MKEHCVTLQVYEGRDYDWRQALPGNDAVHAAVLAAYGNAAEARQLAQNVSHDHLRPEELELIRSAF